MAWLPFQKGHVLCLDLLFQPIFIYALLARSKNDRYFNCYNAQAIQARIAQLVAYRLGTGEVPGSNPGKGENSSVKISNWIVRI